VLPGFSPIIGSTEAEAKRFSDELNELSDPEVGRNRLSLRFGGHDFSHLPLDRPLAAEDFPDPKLNEASRSRTEAIVGFVREHKPTLRQLLVKLAGARGHFTFEGTPGQVADAMAEWITEGCADGFNLMPPVLPEMLDVFIAEVVPILQKRGLFRTAYEGDTLRSHLGLARPAVRTGK
jgi:alkanesulfonate monooxygenase SsuD/methylene tetrahydromethanopterin reductase-like flavin-dependent oxidoreductase (luciferase family)